MDPDWLVMRLQDGSKASSGRAATVAECFSIALDEELEARGLVAKKVAMRTVTSTERFGRGNRRTRVELDVIVDIRNGAPSQLIEALCAAKQKCAIVVGSAVKILMKAELKMIPSGAGSSLNGNVAKKASANN